MTAVKPGIYLEVKRVTIGVGVTAKTEEYRNFWMTLEPEGERMPLLLLDQDFKPTNLRETVPLADFETGRFTYIPQGEKRYQLLRQKMAERHSLDDSRTKEASGAKPEKKPASGWWEKPEKEIKTGDIFKRT
ncbi:MAG: hypothetical protein V1742_08005 [Pseudomonadota bacterium]